MERHEQTLELAKDQLNNIKIAQINTLKWKIHPYDNTCPAHFDAWKRQMVTQFETADLLQV